MKKLLLTLTAVSALSFAVNAQTEKGKFLVGGQVGVNSTTFKDSDVKSTDFSIIPQAGYFIADNIAVGTGVGYTYTEAKLSADNKNTVGSFVLAPFGRLYSRNDSPVKFFGQLSVPMSWGTNKANGEKTGTTAQYAVELAPGIAYFPTSKIGIEFKVRGLYYQNQTAKNELNDTKVTSNSFGLNANSLAPSVGVQFYF